MITTPKSLRLTIGLFGRRNVGKSSLLNALTRQQLAIVSDTPGTTTDPLEKAMELLPFGPVVFIDTAGLDDEGALGAQRIEKTRRVMERCDLALLVTDDTFGTFEGALFDELTAKKIPVIPVRNKTETLLALDCKGVSAHACDAKSLFNIQSLRERIMAEAPESFFVNRPILGDLVPPGACIVLVTPIDKEAPRGRLILPQVQTIRDVLDAHQFCVVTTLENLSTVFQSLKTPPALVVTDSQAFKEVNALTPPDIMLTSFSILFARLKGDLKTFVAGARAIDSLRAGDAVLIAEACTHPPVGEDIGTVKIPRLLEKKVGGKLHFTFVTGCDFGSDLSAYKLIIHCGGCMFNARQIMTRIDAAVRAGVPITNYGLCISAALGILERALAPFPELR